MSLKTRLYVNAEYQETLDTAERYPWPAHTKLTRDAKVLIADIPIQEKSFEDIVTGVAMHTAHYCPGKLFDVLADLRDESNYYVEKIVAAYDKSQLTVHISIEDLMFIGEKKCVNCGQSLDDVYNDEEFKCPHCKAVYKHKDAGNPFDADYVFGSEEFTYSIPPEHI